MDTRTENMKQIKMANVETAAAHFNKNKINTDTISCLSPSVLTRANNSNIFNDHRIEYIKLHGQYQDLSELEEPCEAEITASILEVNGGPIADNYVIEQNHKKRMSCQKDVLMSNLIKKNERLNQENRIPITVENPKEMLKHVEPATLVEHPDDPDFYCLRDTQTEENRKNEDYQFNFRGIRKKEIPRNYLMDTIEDNLFDFEIKPVKKRASKLRNLRD